VGGVEVQAGEGRAATAVEQGRSGCLGEGVQEVFHFFLGQQFFLKAEAGARRQSPRGRNFFPTWEMGFRSPVSRPRSTDRGSCGLILFCKFSMCKKLTKNM